LINSINQIQLMNVEVTDSELILTNFPIFEKTANIQ